MSGAALKEGARFTADGAFVIPAEGRVLSISRLAPDCPVTLTIELTREEEREIVAAHRRWRGFR